MTEETLWCVHVEGPDTVIAQPNKATAEQRAAKWNAQIEEINRRRSEVADVHIRCVVEPWPYSADLHAYRLGEHGGEPEDIC